MVDDSLASARFRQHGRFRIPVESLAARDYYLNDLFVPGTRTQSILTPLARRFYLVGDRFLGRKESDSLPGRTASEWTEIANAITDNLRCIQRGYYGDPSFLILTDYAHSNRGQLVAFVFWGDEAMPRAVAKVRKTETGGSRLGSEFGTLQRLRVNDTLRSSLPEPIALCETGRDTILLERAVPGRSLHFVLRNRRPSVDEMSRHFHSAFEWLAGFHRATFSKYTSLGEIEDTCVAPALDQIQRSENLTTEEIALIRNLRSLMLDLRDERLPMVGVQGDFWTRNVLLGNGDQIAVIDWEAFEAEGLPLDDALMFTVSYALSFQWQFGRWADPGSALFRMFFSSDAPGSVAMEHLNKFCTRIGINSNLLRILIPLFLLRRAANAIGVGGEDGKNSEEVSRWRNLLRTYAKAA